ncbi:MAG: response regulator transcription factor [Myxococcales bacterium]|nr:response regulator transcription factor [Myxococcales bacterium]
MIEVLIVDDHAIVRDGLSRLLHTTPDLRVAAAVDNGADAVAAVGDPKVQVAVVDLSLPHLAGLDLVRVLFAERPDLRVVVFTMQTEDLLAAHLIRAGVLGYVSKDRPLDELLAAIRAVVRGERFISPRLAALVDEPAARHAPHTALSRREAQAFELLLAGKSVGEIAEIMEIGSSTASNHLAKIREKLGVSTNAEVLIYAHRMGLLP